MNALSDRQLIDTYRSTVRVLYAAVCRQAGGDRALAEDIVQETYLRALCAWRRSGLPRSPEAWLRTVARNLLVTHFRRSGREVPAAIEATEPVRSEASVDRVAVRQGLEELGEPRAQLLHGFHVEGRTVGEMAAERRLSERAVEGRLRRARKALAALLGGGTRRS